MESKTEEERIASAAATMVSEAATISSNNRQNDDGVHHDASAPAENYSASAASGEGGAGEKSLKKRKSSKTLVAKDDVEATNDSGDAAKSGRIEGDDKGVVVSSASAAAAALEAAGTEEDDTPGEEAGPLEEEAPKHQSFMEAASSKALRPFVIISSSYLLFTITDGAIRMIVLLHAYTKSFSALEVAIMFTLYELAGVVTNLAAGVMGARWGIKFTLICGLSLQLVSYALLFGWQDDWSKTEAIIYVTFAQMFAGVAKDLTKLGGKTVTKLVTPDEQDTKLFKLVSLITGWKNSLKGVGYFLGSALLTVSYELALGK